MMARIMRQARHPSKTRFAKGVEARMARLVRIGAVIAVMLVGCAGSSTPDVPGSVVADPPVVLPASALPRMTNQVSAVGVDELANEVTHPDELRAVLDEAGFAVAEQRSFGGGTGAFSRVLARGLSFDSEAGASAFVGWIGDHAPGEIVTAERIFPVGAPDGAAVFRHEPDGCCHNDVPAYLAAWQRGASVLFLHAGGPRANARAFVKLIISYDEEV
jgi:hypothetical protein